MLSDTGNKQLHLLFHHTETSLRHYLEQNLGKPVSLSLTDNTTSMLSARVRTGTMHLRMHRMFLGSGEEVLSEIVSFLKNKRRAMPAFRRFIRENRNSCTAKEPNRIPIKTLGAIFDLRELYEEINQEYFGGCVTAAITWGSRSPRCSVRKRTLGSYSERSNMIRINPVLDRKTIPRYYISFVVYHEMLHAALGISKQGERRSVHPREFRTREKLFNDYEKARAWERGRA